MADLVTADQPGDCLVDARSNHHRAGNVLLSGRRISLAAATATDRFDSDVILRGSILSWHVGACLSEGNATH
jgi:hypothetical protein